MKYQNGLFFKTKLPTFYPAAQYSIKTSKKRRIAIIDLNHYPFVFSLKMLKIPHFDLTFTYKNLNL